MDASNAPIVAIVVEPKATINITIDNVPIAVMQLNATYASNENNAIPPIILRTLIALSTVVRPEFKSSITCISSTPAATEIAITSGESSCPLRDSSSSF